MDLKVSVDWASDIRNLSITYNRNIEYITDIIRSNKLTDYGYKLLYNEFINSNVSFEGTPVKKRCLSKDRKEVLYNIPELEVTTYNSELDQSSFNIQELDKSLCFVQKPNKSLYSYFPSEFKENVCNNTKILDCYIEMLGIKYCHFKDLPKDVVKIAEASFSEVFKSKNLIYKIIPLEGKSMTSTQDFIQEAHILKILSSEPGVSRLVDILIVTGKYTPTYLKAWDSFGYIENPRPDFYTKRQKFGVLITEYGGLCLEKHKFRTVKEIQKVILEIACILSMLELKYNFEHRDLHWGNFLIKNGRIQIIDFALGRLKYAEQIVYKDLSEYTWIFEGDEEIDEQFGVYRKMRDIIKDRWNKFFPITNVLWMTYIVNKLFSQINSKKSINVKSQYLKLLDECISINDFYYKISNI